MKEVVIIDAVRTPVGSFGGALTGVPAVELGTIVVKELIRRTGIDPAQVEELIFGCVLQAGLGQNVARQVLIHSGIPQEVPAHDNKQSMCIRTPGCFFGRTNNQSR